MKYLVKTEKTITLSDKDLEDILCCSIEGGCSYWAQIDNSTDEYRQTYNRLLKREGERPTIEKVIVEMWENDMSLIIYADEDDCGQYDAEYQIDLNKFLEGIKMAIDDGIWDGEDICDIDGEVGDAIMQYACYGEVIYG